jgi:bile salt-stimulated lipase
MTEPTVSIDQGKLKGKISTNLRNEDFYSFQGIPYAKPPIGKLRFKVK